MLISSLEKMEEIVKKNKGFRWDGWDVIFSYPSDKARTSKFGARIKGVWHLQRVFKLDSNGWNIPRKYID
jgi:hypothetical protein